MAAGIMDDEESANRCILCTMAMACISCCTHTPMRRPAPTQKRHTIHTHREKRERRTRQLFRRVLSPANSAYTTHTYNIYSMI
jgi:hypothetical protein